MKHRHAMQQLSKFLATILGRQPDEFGLLPDDEGYVTIRTLMKVLAEEPGWRHVRAHQLRELVYTSPAPVIEIDDSRVRAVDRSKLPAPLRVAASPKLLYYPVRRRAYPGILANGLRPAGTRDRITLTADKSMAERLGRRIDPSPVILTVNTTMAGSLGVGMWRYGRQLYLLDSLPQGCFSGPPPPKQAPDPRQRQAAEKPAAPKTPGSYVIDPASTAQPADRSAKKGCGRKNEWKRERKRRSRMDLPRGAER